MCPKCLPYLLIRHFLFNKVGIFFMFKVKNGGEDPTCIICDTMHRESVFTISACASHAHIFTYVTRAGCDNLYNRNIFTVQFTK